VLAWLALAAAGAPVLADGAAGWRALTGHSAGFLAGMALAAYACGRGAERTRGWPALTGLFLAGHAIVLAAGWAVLAASTATSWTFVLPFLPGAVVKSLAAALSVSAVRR
jgi:biotin transport system substrate-specific component